MNIEEITIRQPDDWHVHLRDGQMLQAVLPFTARQFARAIVMPNLDSPITNRKALVSYRERILAALPTHLSFQPLMTYYLTDESDPNDIENLFDEGLLTAVKLYPAHVTTNAQYGISDLMKTHRTLELLEKVGVPLLIHGESTDPDVDIFDRERVFVEKTLSPLLATFEGLKVVLEHITTAFAADFVYRMSNDRLAATITPHHLQLNRNAMFSGGLRPHAYCLPVAKREEDRKALRRAATSGAPCFFLGTDSAPHLKEFKESDCGCAGVFCAPVAMETYAQVFDEEGALDQLESFASINGPTFYGLPINESKIIIRRKKHHSENVIEVGRSTVQVFRSGEELNWQLAYCESREKLLAHIEEPISTPARNQTVLASANSMPRSAAFPWNQHTAPHLPCQRGELPAAVLFPGDPGRVDRFSQIMDNFRILGQNREFRVGVGEFDGIELGVCSTGIGGPSTEIALVEAAELGCRFALRAGGTGALDPSIPLGSLLIVAEALRGGGAASLYAPLNEPAKADPRMIAALTNSANRNAQTYRTTRVASVDGYYAGQGRAYPNAPSHTSSLLAQYTSKGISSLDMESETVLVIGARIGMIAGVLLSVHANRATDKWLEDYGEAQDAMIRVACSALADLVKSEREDAFK